MSRFVSAGTDQDPTSIVEDKWVKAKEQVESSRFSKPPETGKQEDGRSLYEVLQANKAAKQEAFEEASKLRNQFRALDDDEIDFLDTVRQTELSKEAAARREQAEQVEQFRKQRSVAERALANVSQTENEASGEAELSSSWTAKKKRRRVESEDQDAPLIKVRKSSTTEGDGTEVGSNHPKSQTKNKTSVHTAMGLKSESDEPSEKDVQHTEKPQPSALGLDAYGSEDDD